MSDRMVPRMPPAPDPCPKCGGAFDMSPRYVSAWHGCKVIPADKDHPDTEHLHVFCRTCGYTRWRPCDDAPVPSSAAIAATLPEGMTPTKLRSIADELMDPDADDEEQRLMQDDLRAWADALEGSSAPAATHDTMREHIDAVKALSRDPQWQTALVTLAARIEARMSGTTVAVRHLDESREGTESE